MIAVLFEVYPKAGCEGEYLDVAATLRPLVETVDGFISVERFRSVNPEGKILSLSFWRDEDAVVKGVKGGVKLDHWGGGKLDQMSVWEVGLAVSVAPGAEACGPACGPRLGRSGRRHTPREM